MRTVKVILNPYANSDRANQQVDAVRSALNRVGLLVDLTVLTRPGQAKGEALEAAMGGYDAVIAAGGDGTVNEIINGLLLAAEEEATCPLGILPLGTGNDFSDMMGLPRDLSDSASVIASRNTRQVDAGWVSFTSDPAERSAGWQGRYFGNNCAAAMEPVVILEANRIRRLTGSIRYLAAMFRSLRKLSAWNMEISWDEGQIDEAAYLVSIANTPRTGGLFTVAPGACSQDGLLDFVIVPRIAAYEVPVVLMRLLRGTHLQDARVISGRTRGLTISSRPATPLHVDGELLTQGAHSIHVEVLPGSITLLAPAV